MQYPIFQKYIPNHVILQKYTHTMTRDWRTGFENKIFAKEVLVGGIVE